MTVLIDLLYVAGCRNLALARQRLEEAVAQSGADVAIREREISDPQDAEAFSGSRTVLVDGRDPVAGEASASVSCRLHATEAGVDGDPTVAQLVVALPS